MSALKFKRVAKIIFDDDVIDGLRVIFKVDRYIDGFSPFTTVQIYNMNRQHQNLATTKGTRFELVAGYEGNSSTLFTGRVTTGFTVRDGADFVTTVNVADFLDINNKTVNFSVKKPNNLENLIRLIAKNVSVDVGEIILNNNNFVNSLTFSASFLRTLNTLSKSFNFTWYIKDQKLFVYSDDKITTKRKFTFSQLSGLLTTPVITDHGIDVQVLLEPSINQFDSYVVEASRDLVESQVGTLFGQRNTSVLGLQRALSIIHEGDTHSNKWVSTISGQHLDG